jgi:hypothetical protein
MGGRADSTKVILVIIDGVGHRILRIPLTMPIVVDYQISRETHQPVRQVTLFRVVLIEGPVYANEDFLRKIFGSIGIRSEPVSEIEDPTRERLNDLFPRNAIARSRSSHEFRTVRFHCSF